MKTPLAIPEEFNAVLQQALTQIAFPTTPEQMSYSTISHLPGKQNYDLTESAHKNSYSPPGGPVIGIFTLISRMVAKAQKGS